jgi:sodium/hydrogen antiporter
MGAKGLDHRERWVVAFFGVRGVGSIYYIAYAAGAATFPEERWLWSTVGFTVALSVLLHGILATPVMTRLDRLREDAAENSGARRGDPAPH